MIITFHNVLISIEAETPEAAYKLLCERCFGDTSKEGLLEYTTDTYTVDGNSDDKCSTLRIMPQ